jgi:hypothetical protein
MDEEKTRLERLLNRAKNNKWLALLTVIGAVVIWLSTLTDAFQKIWGSMSWLYTSDPVYAKAHVLRSRPSNSLAEEIGSATTVWCAWQTGSTQLASQQWKTIHPNIRMILTHPESITLEAIAKLGKMQPPLMAQSIRQLSSDVEKNGGEVRWFDGPMQSSLIIVNPESDDGWARIEVLLPFQEASLRPSILVTKKGDREFFAKLKKTFTDIWDRSSPANP